MTSVESPVTRFRDAAFVAAHIQAIHAFYFPRSLDDSDADTPASSDVLTDLGSLASERGGFYHCLRDDGSVFDAHSRHLVNSTRTVLMYSWAYRRFAAPEHLAAARRALAFLRRVHFSRATGGYAWTLNTATGARNERNETYGLAFVLLACSTALKSGVAPAEARRWLHETYSTMQRRMADPFASSHVYPALYADSASQDWSETSPYRGQNANMHACEALIAAFNATGEAAFINHAFDIAHALCISLARVTGAACGHEWVFEHYKSDWSAPDFDYAREAGSADAFRPYGFQTGHILQWAKLLLILRRHAGSQAGRMDVSWLLPTAQRTVDDMCTYAWDVAYGGFVYAVMPQVLEAAGGDGVRVCDDDKYWWVQTEAIAAFALLADALPVGPTAAKYWAWYDKVWAYSWANFIDHTHGAWYNILTRRNVKKSNEKSPLGKVDYHSAGVCYEIMNVL